MPQGSVSSDLEKTLIKATRPDNDPAKRKHVNLLLQAAEQAFPVYMDPEVPKFRVLTHPQRIGFVHGKESMCRTLFAPSKGGMVSIG